MRKTLQHILASALLVGGIVACGEHGSPTAPPVPGPIREYRTTTVQQGPASLIVNYDLTWSEERARDVANRGLSDAMNLINMQTGTRGLVNIDGNVYLQGEIPGIALDTTAPAGLYLPINAIFCATVPGAKDASECIAHQLQHRYAQTHACARWVDVLHEDPRIESLVADTLMVTCERTRELSIIQHEVSMFDCDTDGTGK